MDITETLAPKSDQMDAEDLIGGARTFTVESVNRGSVEQPVEIRLAEFPRCFRPSKTVRRILAAAWGTDAKLWVGRRMTLFRDPTVVFGGEAVGGIRVSHLSDIDKPITLALMAKRGRRASFTVDPLPATPAVDIDELKHRITNAATLDDLDAIAAELKSCDLGNARGTVQAAWTARRAELKAPPPADEDYGDLLDAAAGVDE